jgi:hypothetical protein
MLVNAAAAHPLIDFNELELPEPTDSVGGKALVVNPPVHGVSSDTEVSRNFINRVPAFVGHVRLLV